MNQFDVNGPLEEEVYVVQPLSFEILDQEDMVLRLRNALYGLKQAPHAWNMNRFFRNFL